MGTKSCDFDWVFAEDAVIEMTTCCSFEEKKDNDDEKDGLLLRNAAEMVPRNNSRITTPRRAMDDIMVPGTDYLPVLLLGRITYLLRVLIEL